MTPTRDTQTSPQAPGTPQAGGTLQMLTFWVGTEAFGLTLVQVKEIIEYGHVTQVPNVKPWVRGVINLRGEVLPVVDLAVRLGRPPTVITRRTCIIVVEIEEDGESRDVGVAVDAVSAVVDVPESNIEPPSAMGHLLQQEFFRGMARTDGRFTIVLDPDAILSDSQEPEPPRNQDDQAEALPS